MPQFISIRRSLIAAVSFAAIITVYLAYAPGLTGAFYYDDYQALRHLPGLAHGGDTWTFIFGGTAGPLGRPIALATFVPHASGWPENGVAILRVNVIIHILNAGLLGLLAFMILRLRGETRSRAFWIALGGATLWAVLPILASTSLITIQRMTGLSAFFGLLGLVGFVGGYFIRTRRPRLGFSGQIMALGLGTSLAMFAKENGALVPVFALVIDAILLRHLPQPAALRRIMRGGLTLILLAILIYLSPLTRDWFAFNEFRGFSPWDRLRTQAVVLWQYIHLTVAPLPTAFGPFHDHRGIDFTVAQSTFAAGAWAGVLALALWVQFKRNNPWLLFATLWFLTGHLLESSTILLENYFEHRNYLAVFGLCLALAVGAAHAPGKLKRLAPVFFVALVALNASILGTMTSLWGKQSEAAEVWAAQNPGSPRAALHSVFIELGAVASATADYNIAMLRHQRLRFAMTVLDRTSRACPECLDVRLQALAYSCLVAAPEDTRGRFEALVERASTGTSSLAAMTALSNVEALVEHGECDPLMPDDVLLLVGLLIDNPDFARNTYTMYLPRLHFLAAKIADDRGDWAKAEQHLAKGEAASAIALPILQFQVYLYNKLGRFEDSLAAIDRRRTFNRKDLTVSDEELDTLVSWVTDARENPRDEQPWSSHEPRDSRP